MPPGLLTGSAVRVRLNLVNLVWCSVVHGPSSRGFFFNNPTFSYFLHLRQIGLAPHVLVLELESESLLVYPDLPALHMGPCSK